MPNRDSVETITADLIAVVALVNQQFGANYATKNPALIQHLLDKIQNEEERKLVRER